MDTCIYANETITNWNTTSVLTRWNEHNIPSCWRADGGIKTEATSQLKDMIRH